MTGFPIAAAPAASDGAALESLCRQLRARFRDSARYILAYGSCLRSGDIHDGLLDLYVVVESYRAAYASPAMALGNRLLPPNVFYAQAEAGGRALRCKVAVVSMRDFRRRNGKAALESYFWGRFAQPVGVVWERHPERRGELEGVLASAARRLLSASLPALPASGTLEELWGGALALSYSSELRSEGRDRAARLASDTLRHCIAVTRLADVPQLELAGAGGRPRYRFACPRWRRPGARLAWAWRRLVGKPRSLLRLLKALFTFAGGLDYLAWKLQRHSGRVIEIPARVRRRPLVFGWGYFWRLYRRGVFR